MASQEEFNTSTTRNKFRVFLIPYFARGHLIPMTDFACLLAATKSDVEPTMVVTPGNAALIRTTIDRSTASGFPVQLRTYPFPSMSLTSKDEKETTGAGSQTKSYALEQSYHLARSSHEELIYQDKPDALVADAHFWWISAIAADLGIPRILFLATGSFSSLALANLFQMRQQHRIHLHDPVTIPGLPGPEVQIPLSELPDFLFPKDNNLGQQMDNYSEINSKYFGVVVSTAYEIEADYCKTQYEMTPEGRSYFIGPISLFCIGDSHSVIGRGGDSDKACMRWLDSKEKRSVVFISFGSQSYLKSAQLRELAMGLENSRTNFLWVVRGVDPEEDWMPEGWEARVAETGLVLRGWAPQLAILSHMSVGAFLTHCGWNSILEGITAGVPMLTWPLESDQFINERFVVEITGCGKRIWEGGKRSTREAERDLVPRDAIATSISKFMEPSGLGDIARLKARQLSVIAKDAVAEGGSSRKDLNRLINDLIETNRKKLA